MLQFIHDDFKLDLTHLKVTFNSENIWFKTEVESEFSFPFDIPWNEWAKISSSFHYNSINNITIFKGKLYRDGDLSDATLKIDETKGKFVTGMIYAGFEGFTVFSKSLKELPLDNFVVPNLKAHAMSVINQDYPAVSHNFPMIHTDKYDPETPEFFGFKKIINNYSAGAYVENTLQLATNIDLIKNIMQPLPYLLHVLKKGFEVDGFDLQGDVLEIPEFQKALIFRDGDYYKSFKKDEISVQVSIDEWNTTHSYINGIQHVTFDKQITIEKKGSYLIFGDIISLWYATFGPTLVFSKLENRITKISGGVTTTLYLNGFVNNVTGASVTWPYKKKRTAGLDFTVSFEAGDILRFQKIEPRRNIKPSPLPDYPFVTDFKIIPIRYKNPDNSPIISLLDLDEVDLRKVVPDMTFSELIQKLIVWKKLDIKPVGNIVYMNYVTNQLDRNAAIKLSDNEVEEPLIKNNDERSYELAFSDGKTHETYKYDSVFIDSSGAIINNYQVKKDTTQISIDALPYPVVNRNGATTAFAFDDETTKLRLVFYNAISLDYDDEPEVPTCFENYNMLIPKIYENNYKDWLNFLLNSKTYQWDFVMSVEKFREITAQSLVYAYNNYHIFTEIEKERIDFMYWKITAKTEVLR